MVLRLYGDLITMCYALLLKHSKLLIMCGSGLGQNGSKWVGCDFEPKNGDLNWFEPHWCKTIMDNGL